MADGSKIGTDWQDDELDAIVADYFDILMPISQGGLISNCGTAKL